VPIRVGINGFGRIGRLTYRAIYEKYGLNGDVQVVALNDLTDAKTNAHLLEFDSNYGPFKGKVGHEGNDLFVDGHKIQVFAEKEPGAIPWGSQDVQIVVESTGFFTDATTSSPTPPARPTAWPRSPRCSTRRGASTAAC
jgi:glyceraldehyde 3-phosphate dehydrogenase